MNILVIDEEFPYPLNTGKRIRTFNLVRELARLNRVSYLAYGEDGSEGFENLKRTGMTPYAVRPRNRRQSGVGFAFRLLVNLLSKYPYIVTSHYTSRFQRTLRSLLGSERFDVVVCEWTPYARFLEEAAGTKTLIVAHNIESSIWKRYCENESNPLKKSYIAIQHRKVRNFERRCFHWVDGATAVSSEEAAIISGLGVNYPVAVIENGVDVDYFLPAPGREDSKKLVFTGSMDWRPNQDACLFFTNEILPLLRQRVPGSEIYFVGRNPPRKITNLNKVSGVHVTGSVEDVRPYIAQAAAVVVPLRIGGGSRLKILEAMAMRKAVISTAIGAEGLEVTDGKNILIADTPSEFAETVIRCLEDAPLRETIAEAGYQLVHNVYRWQTLGDKYHRYLSAIVNEA